MVLEHRFAKKMIKKGEKPRESYVDLLFKPFTLEILRNAGMTKKRGLTSTQILKITKEYGEIERTTLLMRLKYLKSERWLRRRKIEDEERKRCDIKGNTYVYFLSKKSEDYLEKWGGFANPKGVLVKSRIKGVGY